MLLGKWLHIPIDEVDHPEISDEIMSQLDEAMDFWTEDRIAVVEDKKRQSIENPEKFLDYYSNAIWEYQEFKESEVYLSSICGASNGNNGITWRD